MEFKLNDLTSVYDFLRSANYWALPLLFSFAVPLFYIAFKKLTEKSITPSEGLQATIMNFLTLPRMDSWVLIFSLASFVIGCFTVIYGANRQEDRRLKGLTIKAFLESKSYTKVYTSYLFETLGISPSEQRCIAEAFPSKFIITNESYYNDSLDKYETDEEFVLVDSLTRTRIISTATKLLDSYLRNYYVSSTGSIKSSAELFNSNYVFSYDVMINLATDSSNRYVTNLIDPTDPGKGFGIVRIKPYWKEMKLLDAYLSNNGVLPPGKVLPYDSISNQYSLFSHDLIESLIADSNRKYSMKLIDAASPEKGFGIVKNR